MFHNEPKICLQSGWEHTKHLGGGFSLLARRPPRKVLTALFVAGLACKIDKWDSDDLVS